MEIDEIIKIMLKGVAENTDISAIKERLEKVNKENRSLIIKLGLDPSAPDIHLGHAVVLRKIRQLQNLGHQAVIIIGDFTGMIGDPTGKSKVRKQLSKEEVIKNAETYQSQIFKVLNPEKTLIKFNSEWLEKMNFKDVINLAAKCTVARMLERDDFKKRYKNNQPISIHEFFYPLMQAYDSVVIKADIELGGTDQTFNVLMGRNIQKDFGQEPQITLFMPILEGIDGVEKMSKSLGNYIGINENPDVMYTKIMKIPDNLIIKYYNLCTDLHPTEIEKIEKRMEQGENPRDIKMELAKEIVTLYHSKNDAENAEQNFKLAFQEEKAPDNVQKIQIDVKTENLQQALIDSIMSSGNYKSKAEIKRLIAQGALKINGEKVTDLSNVKEVNEGTILQLGKGKFYQIINI